MVQLYRDKTKVIPIGLDEADYPHASQELKDRWTARSPKPYFLFVGVLRYYKGLHTLIGAAKNVYADILIAEEGPMEAELKAQAVRARLTNVHFLGAVSDLDKAALLELCAAFVFPAHLRSEAHGLSLVEAAMFGKPMISCEIGTGTSFVKKAWRDGDCRAARKCGRTCKCDAGDSLQRRRCTSDFQSLRSISIANFAFKDNDAIIYKAV